MATNKRKEAAQRWKGDEVEPRPGSEAERAADRVEGNEPVRVDAEARRLHEHSDRELNHRRRRAAAEGDPEDETAEAAEEHRDRQAAQGYPPRGKL
jgi:hypothetical protein